MSCSTNDFFLERELFFSLITKTVASRDVTVLEPLVKQMCEIAIARSVAQPIVTLPPSLSPGGIILTR